MLYASELFARCVGLRKLGLEAINFLYQRGATFFQFRLQHGMLHPSGGNSVEN